VDLKHDPIKIARTINELNQIIRYVSSVKLKVFFWLFTRHLFVGWLVGYVICIYAYISMRFVVSLVSCLFR
jgi:hypothetical protein